MGNCLGFHPIPSIRPQLSFQLLLFLLLNPKITVNTILAYRILIRFSQNFNID